MHCIEHAGFELSSDDVCSACSKCNPGRNALCAAMQVQSVLYIDPKVSGENRLLLAVRQQAT